MRLKMLLWRWTTRSILAAAVFMLVLASGPLSAAEPRKGGSLGIALETDAATLDTLGISSINDRQAAIILYDKLLDIDAKGNIVPGIAQKIETSADATSFKLTLCSGVKFSTSRTLRWRAVLYTA